MSNKNEEKNEFGVFSPKSFVGGVGFTIVKGLIDLAKKRNQEDPDEKTAPDSLFDNIQDKLDNIKTQIKPGDSEEDVVKKLKEQIDEVKKENSENPDEETADDKLFNKIKGLFDKNIGKTEDDVLIDEGIEIDEVDSDELVEDDKDSHEIKVLKQKINNKRRALNDKLKELRSKIREERRKRMGELRALREEYVDKMTESGRADELKKKGKKNHPKGHKKGKGRGKGRK